MLQSWVLWSWALGTGQMGIVYMGTGYRTVGHCASGYSGALLACCSVAGDRGEAGTWRKELCGGNMIQGNFQIN